MTKFIRARNEGQKQERFEEIKAAGRKIFDEKPYSEITISDIAQKLSWSRANLYKYVSTKEEPRILWAVLIQRKSLLKFGVALLPTTQNTFAIIISSPSLKKMFLWKS